MTIDKQQLRGLANAATPIVESERSKSDGEMALVYAFRRATSPSTVLALLDEIAEVLADRDAMQSMLTQTTRERERLRKLALEACDGWQGQCDLLPPKRIDAIREEVTRG